jgi:hypothetical protein
MKRCMTGVARTAAFLALSFCVLGCWSSITGSRLAKPIKIYKVHISTSIRYCRWSKISLVYVTNQYRKAAYTRFNVRGSTTGDWVENLSCGVPHVLEYQWRVNGKLEKTKRVTYAPGKMELWIDGSHLGTYSPLRVTSDSLDFEIHYSCRSRGEQNNGSAH